MNAAGRFGDWLLGAGGLLTVAGLVAAMFVPGGLLAAWVGIALGLSGLAYRFVVLRLAR